jgi:hypothetical protein
LADTVVAVGSTATDWITLLLTTLGGGAVGSVVTTYGAQTRERRQARAEARGAVKIAEKAVSIEDDEELEAALEDLATKAMLAGLPRFLVDLYSESKRSYIWGLRQGRKETDKENMDAWLTTAMDCRRVADETARLFVDATWHPWLGFVYRRYRARKLRFMLKGTSPFTEGHLRQYEHRLRQYVHNRDRELIQRAKRARRAKD